MSDDRAQLFTRIRDALAPLPRRTPLPDFSPDIAVSKPVQAGLAPSVLFCQQLERVHGRVFREPSPLVTFLEEKGAFTGYVDPALLALLRPAFPGRFELCSDFDRERVDEYGFGITRATGAIAETGSLILTDGSTSRRLGALTPWIHVALLYESEIFLHLGEALAALGDDPNVIFCTGPSKTADIEGILIEGVHGPGEQIALLLDAP
jgi:L-lactate dehydrogenase complex protein LldG